MREETRERPAADGERCTCGRQALVVFATVAWDEVGWCGRSDGRRSGRCVFCGDPAGHREERCWRYPVLPDSLRLDSEPGPEAA